LRNGIQILSVVTATFSSFEGEGPSQNCGQLSDSVDELACEWRCIIQNIPASGDVSPDFENWAEAITKVRSSLPKIVTES
jgi:ethanolamine phosphate transferase 2 subunit G